MKVAIVTTRHGAQDDRIYYKQGLSLAKQMEVTIIAPDDGKKLEWSSGVCYRPINRRSNLFGRFISVIEAVKAIRRENPDFCHLHDLDLVFSIPFIRIYTKSKIIYDSHEAYPEQILLRKRIPKFIRPFFSRIVDYIEKTLVGYAHYAITADEPTSLSFVKKNIPTSVIFNYPKLDIFITKNRELGVEMVKYSGLLPIIYQGTVSADRGLFHMIEAMRIIKKVEPKALLRIVGLRNDSLKEKALKRAKEYGVSDVIEIVSWIQHLEIAYSLKSSLLGLIPFQPEEKYKKNIPIKMFEYMACALPIIAADLQPIRSYFDGNEVGVLYDSTKVEELAHCVLELLRNEELRARMAQNGKRLVESKWNWEVMEVRLLNIYKKLGLHHYSDH